MHHTSNARPMLSHQGLQDDTVDGGGRLTRGLPLHSSATRGQLPYKTGPCLSTAALRIGAPGQPEGCRPSIPTWHSFMGPFTPVGLI
jgi:hypothetical protein